MVEDDFLCRWSHKIFKNGRYVCKSALSFAQYELNKQDTMIYLIGNIIIHAVRLRRLTKAAKFSPSA